MKLVIVRHAIAEDRVAFAETGQPDSARPLTDAGRKKMRANACGLRTVVPSLDVLATSPYVRARETADILAETYGRRVDEVPALAHGGSHAALLAWLQEETAETVALVGHEPDLGLLIGWLVTGEAAPIVPLKKGGAALVLFPDLPLYGDGEIRWVLTPKLLRQLGR
ncbi:MAG: histidine phosphatase family protein [Gemmatimonadota bacterium]|nr:histidine phosphatase family protein [Gemmatimonadota bacterium]